MSELISQDGQELQRCKSLKLIIRYLHIPCALDVRQRAKQLEEMSLEPGLAFFLCY